LIVDFSTYSVYVDSQFLIDHMALLLVGALLGYLARHRPDRVCVNPFSSSSLGFFPSSLVAPNEIRYYLVVPNEIKYLPAPQGYEVLSIYFRL